MAISVFPAAGGGGGATKIEKVDLIKATGTWTCPADVTKIEVFLCGGGGGGASGGNGFGGGGGGSLRYDVLDVTPGTTYTVTIGAGGAANATGAASSFGNLLSINGGTHGIAGNDNNLGQRGGWGRGLGSGAAWGGSNNQLAGASPAGFKYGGAGGGVQGGGGGGGGSSEWGVPGVVNSGGGGAGGGGGITGAAGGSGVCEIRYWSAL